MKKDQIHFGDWGRVFFGEVPAVFYLELVIRAVVVYLLLTVSMRLMGKRMSSHLSRNELSALVSLAAAVGVPMMAPNRGLLPAVIIAIVVIGLQRLIAARAVKSQVFEQFSQGNVSMLVADAVIQWQVLKKVGIAREEVFAQLRAAAIMHLGEVQRLYMEANGSFTLIKNDKPRPGLSIVPDVDSRLQSELKLFTDRQVCQRCGNHKSQANETVKECPNCRNNCWVSPVTDVD